MVFCTNWWDNILCDREIIITHQSAFCLHSYLVHTCQCILLAFSWQMNRILLYFWNKIGGCCIFVNMWMCKTLCHFKIHWSLCFNNLGMIDFETLLMCFPLHSIIEMAECSPIKDIRCLHLEFPLFHCKWSWIYLPSGKFWNHLHCMCWHFCGNVFIFWPILFMSNQQSCYFLSYALQSIL